MGDVSLVAVAGCRQLGDEFLVAVAYMRDNRGEPGYGSTYLYEHGDRRSIAGIKESPLYWKFPLKRKSHLNAARARLARGL